MTEYKKIYSKIISAKNGSQIPETFSGKTIESRYNPENDAKRQVALFSTDNLSENFIVVLGAAGGFFLKELVENYPEKTFLAVENTQEDLNLLFTLPLYSTLKTKNNVVFSSLSDLKGNIVKNFLPVLYNGLKILPQQAWILENKEINEDIKNIINSALSEISADYSVQVHFGKIWNHNILSNLQLYEKIQKNKIAMDTSKTAVILGAGPSLDYKINELNKNRKDYFIIATDTAFQALIKRKISADAVVSLDGQYVSESHFFNLPEKNNTIFLFDLCGNPSAARKVFLKNREKLFFFISGHPLCKLLNETEIRFLELNSGSGTVTIAALDFALQNGFKKILISGADFSYINGKPYTSGTYLESLYNTASKKTVSSEQMYSKLMFRTELKTLSKTARTTEVLQNYKNSLIKYLEDNQIEYLQKDDFYYLTVKNERTLPFITEKEFMYKNWIKNYILSLENHNVSSKEDLKPEDIGILPLMSNLKNIDNYNRIGLDQLRNIAVNLLKR